jgi:hypothetical protein
MPEWKATQRGGAATFECKWQDPSKSYKHKDGSLHPGDDMWHPHLHVVSEGTFIDKRTLSKLWLKATGDSYIVDIKQLKDAHEAAYYVAKYVTKGTSGEVWSNPDKAQEWIIATRGMRACFTYGTWRGIKLTGKAPWPEDAKPIGTYIHILAAARRGELWAIAALSGICPSEDPEEIRARFIMDTGDG